MMRYKPLLILTFLLVSATAAQSPKEQPETIMATFRAKPGNETALQSLIEFHWTTARRLNAIRPELHVTVRGTEENDRTYFVHIFTWRDARIPDAAPPEIRSIWDRMNTMVEARNGHPGIEFVEVSSVVPQVPAR